MVYSSYGDLDGLVFNLCFIHLSTLALPCFLGGLFQLGFVEGDVLVIRVFVCFFSATWGLVNHGEPVIFPEIQYGNHRFFVGAARGSAANPRPYKYLWSLTSMLINSIT